MDSNSMLKTPDLPVIVQTAYIFDESEEKVLDYGLDGYIAKPIRINLLVDLLSGLFIGKG